MEYELEVEIRPNAWLGHYCAARRGSSYQLNDISWNRSRSASTSEVENSGVFHLCKAEDLGWHVGLFTLEGKGGMGEGRNTEQFLTFPPVSVVCMPPITRRFSPTAWQVWPGMVQ